MKRESDIRNILSNCQICVVGLGYVGIPMARLFASRYRVIGYDVDEERVKELQRFYDRTGEVSEEELRAALESRLKLTERIELVHEERGREGGITIYIVAVPTPVDSHSRPDLKPLKAASRAVGKVIENGDIVIYESTVYPGTTEEECIPEIEEVSGMRLNREFYAGYSPERINPGDKEHTVETIVKITSGSTEEVAEIVDQLYGSVLRNGTHKASSIRVAEAAKLIENTQRDVNIAFMNELSKIFEAMEIDTQEVLRAAETKWNFVSMRPGLVGGHCIGVDPYYLIEQAKVYGVMPRVIQSARSLNDGMGTYVATRLIELMNRKGVMVKGARILILGFAFKENCSDYRNTKVADIYKYLSEYTQRIKVVDPHVDRVLAEREYGIAISERVEEGEEYDGAIMAVSHKEFGTIAYRKIVPEPGVIFDVRGVLPREIVDGRL